MTNSLEQALGSLGLTRTVGTVVTRVRVDFDPALTRPTKPIGRYVPEDEARKLRSLGQSFLNFGPRG